VNGTLITLWLALVILYDPVPEFISFTLLTNSIKVVAVLIQFPYELQIAFLFYSRPRSPTDKGSGVMAVIMFVLLLLSLVFPSLSTPPARIPYPVPVTYKY